MEKKKMSGKKIAILCAIVAVAICVVFGALMGIGKGTNDRTNEGLENIYPDDMTYVSTETEYCEVRYPEKWGNKTKVKVEENDFETIVKYYGLVGDNKEQLLFEVCFGGAGEIPIGVFTANGVSTDVGITYGELNLKGWTEEDMDTIYAMQEDVNYVIMQLENEKGFEKVE